jgi:hypothetical protein
LSPDLWVPGAAEPSLDDFVKNVHRQIERYTATHTAERTHVEVELGDGERLTLLSLSGQPGYGFLTLSVHTADGEAEELPGLGIPDGNPPSGVAAGYVWFDVMALLFAPRLLAAVQRTWALRRRPVPGTGQA